MVELVRIVATNQFTQFKYVAASWSMRDCVFSSKFKGGNPEMTVSNKPCNL